MAQSHMSREILNIIGWAAFEDSMYVKSKSILIHELMLGRHDDCLLTQGVKVAENGLKKDGRSRDHPTRSNYNKTYAEDSMDVKIVVTGVGGKDGEGRTRNEERDHHNQHLQAGLRLDPLPEDHSKLNC